MADLRVIAIGKLRTPHWLAAQRDYEKRIRHYLPLELLELKDRVGQGTADAVAVKKEGDDLLCAATAPFRVLLTPDGRALDSIAFSKQVLRWVETYPRIDFLIGGPLGFSDAVRRQAHFALALSPMTFPHELARVVFLEQLYRALNIGAGEKYHK
jgi:23S rRNA (pseudouridine1915-N3)-methyltransferase